MMETWLPSGTRRDTPRVGALVARDHGVWRVAAVVDTELSDEDRNVWLEAGMPDLPAWNGRPHNVYLEHVGGAEPEWVAEVLSTAAYVPQPATLFPERWHVYPTDRWPMCSCCREPMPCRAEMQDREVAAALNTVEKFATRRAGSCWACGDLITRRQNIVTYPGDNLDLPGGPEVRFHTRSACGPSAAQYELRWIAVDPRRERILTYPKCGGILVVHGDGSSECRSGTNPVGSDSVGEPDCRGHFTHDHATHTACYIGENWFGAIHDDDVTDCPRGCSPKGHPGTRTTRRPARQPFDSVPLFGAS